MGIWMRNRVGFETTQIEYRIFYEHIANGKFAVSLTGNATAPSHSAGDYMKVVLGANSDGSSPGIEFLTWSASSTRQISRMIGVWGTKPGNSDLVMQTQVDRRVTYREPYLFDADLQDFHTNAVWIERGGYGFPPACVAAYFYVESERHDEFNLAQVNLASRCDEGVGGLPSMGFVTQVKSLTRPGVVENQDDDVRCLLDPNNNHYGIMLRDTVRAWIRSRGYELMPNG
jgi:hypothetical protein